MAETTRGGAPVRNFLAKVRSMRGLSAAGLAARTGVSRQTIYAIEANGYAPNTALALRLAQVLEVNVEDLFRLAEEDSPRQAELDVDFVLGEEGRAMTGQSLQLCRVGTKMVAVPQVPIPAFLPTADAVFAPGTKKLRGQRAILLGEPPELDRLLIAGCDPAMSVLAAHAARSDTNLVLASSNSSEALRLLKKGRIHVAGTHLRDQAVLRTFGSDVVSVVTFASWEEGLVVAAGNPLRIRSVADLARKKVRIVNRESGAGSRVLLDEELAAAGVPTSRVSGYDSVVGGHLGAAWHVMAGLADACIATGAAAQAFGLDFLPIVSERYDLVVRREFATLPAIQRLFDVLQRSAFRRELELLGGYDTSATGTAVS